MPKTKEGSTLIKSQRLKGGGEDDVRQRREKKRQASKKREKLKNGQVVSSNAHKYKIIELLGSGGFGDVYRVENENSELFAMKTEAFFTGIDKRMLRLKMESQILNDCTKAEEARKKHFVIMADRGRTTSFKFLVMGLVGPSLDDIRKDVLNRNYTKSSAMQLAIQTCEAVWDLHEVGYIHRDIKPQNFAVGLGDKQTTVYMLDFGIARRFYNAGTRVLKIPREKVKFIGTIRFASRNCHQMKEQGRMDDLEVWIYMAMDLFDDGIIPWRKQCDKEKVLQMKQQLFQLKFPKVWQKLPKDFSRVVKYVDGLNYVDDPDYKYIIEALKKIAEEQSIDISLDVDWFNKLKKKRKEDEETDLDLEKEDSDEDDDDDDDDDEESRRASKSKHKSAAHRKSKGSVKKIDGSMASKKGSQIDGLSTAKKTSSNMNNKKLLAANAHNRIKGGKEKGSDEKGKEVTAEENAEAPPPAADVKEDNANGPAPTTPKKCSISTRRKKLQKSRERTD